MGLESPSGLTYFAQQRTVTLGDEDRIFMLLQLRAARDRSVSETPPILTESILRSAVEVR